MQVGLVTAAYFGVGAGAGALLGGQLLHHQLGWSTTWTIAAGLVAVSAAAAVAVPPLWSWVERRTAAARYLASLQPSALRVKLDENRKER